MVRRTDSAEVEFSMALAEQLEDDRLVGGMYAFCHMALLFAIMHLIIKYNVGVCVCARARVRACVRACVRVCVCVCVLYFIFNKCIGHEKNQFRGFHVSVPGYRGIGHVKY